MQNKGFVKVFALLLTLVCVFYLSFSFVTTYQMNKVDEITKTQGEEAGAHYLDSVMNNPVWLGAYSLKDCREMEISLGLDLKGGMNVILEVSVPEVVKALADHKELPQNLITWKRNGEESIHTPYFHGETTGMT